MVLTRANVIADFKTLKGVLTAKIKGEKIADDKTMLMERVIQLVSNLKGDSKLRVELTNNFVKELWDSLEHPPMLYVGDKYAYRAADGSNNVGLCPDHQRPCRGVADGSARTPCFPVWEQPGRRMPGPSALL